MSNTILYGYLLDDALKNATTIDSGTSDQGYGYLNSERYSYFNTLVTVNDERTTRLEIINNKVGVGDLSFVFDSDKFDIEILKSLSDTQLKRIFNIIERLYLQQSITDSAIERILTLGGSTYAGYVSDSFIHADSEGTAKVYAADKTYVTTDIKDYIAFDFQISDNSVITIHLWIGSNSFGTNYPYTTITGVVAPYDLDVLVNPGSLSAVMNINMLQNSSNYIFTQAQATAKLVKDHTGVYIFNTKYVVNATNSVQIPFALPYCGAKVPTSLECRKAIREYLAANTILGEDSLKELFPELYISARFYLVPVWDYYNSFTDGIVYTSICNLTHLLEVAGKVYKGYADEFRNAHLEVLENGYTKFKMLSMPDELNDKILSIREQHPTYIDYSTTSVGWKYMTSDTQEFSGKIIRAIKVLKSEITSSEFLTVEVDGKNYISFTSGEAEYLIMTEQSYLNMIG